MGLAEFLLGAKNPFAMWANDHQNYLAALGAGLGQGQNIQSGLSAGLAAVPQAKLLDDKALEQRKAETKVAAQTDAFGAWLKGKRPDLVPLLDAGVSPAELFNQAMAPTGGAGSEYDSRFAAGKQYGLTGDALNTFALSGSVPGTNKQNVTYSLAPTFGTDSATGKQGMGVTGSDGSFKLVDTGSFQPMGPGGVAAARAEGGGDAKTAVAARAALPSAEQNYGIAIKAADALLGDQAGMSEQFGNILGVPQQWTPAYPGSKKANFRVQLDQLTGQAFLNIRQALKGAGAVTDYEGQRGEVAISRAQAAAERGDQKAFEAAVIEFKDAITKGLDLLRQQAQGGYAAGSPAVAGGGGNQTSTGVQWSITP